MLACTFWAIALVGFLAARTVAALGVNVAVLVALGAMQWVPPAA